MQEYTGPSLMNYLVVLGFLLAMFVGFYYLKKKQAHNFKKTKFKKKNESFRDYNTWTRR